MAKKSGRAEVASEKLMEVLTAVSKKVDSVESLVEIQTRRSNRWGSDMAAVGSKVKRLETTIEKRMSSFEERMNEMEGAIKTILEWGAMKADLNELATKSDLERMKEEIIEPIIKAVDKDAEAIFDHGKRIVVLERKVGMATK